jgi:hypothetical protein
MYGKLSVLAAVTLSGTACTSASPAPHASIEVDRATCESGLTTLATFDGTANYGALAVAPDGTAFVTMLGSSPASSGILAVPPSGGPAQLVSDYDSAARAWVDGGALWIAGSDGSLRTVPTTGGTPLLIGQIPDASIATVNGRLSTAYTLDATHLYLTVTSTHPPAFNLEVWSIAREGGAVQMLFSSTDPRFQNAYLGPLAAVADSLYFVTRATADDELLMRLPKTGGTPVAVRTIAQSPFFLVPFGMGLWSDGAAVSPQSASNVVFVPLDPTTPLPEAISGIGFADVSVADGAGAYVGFTAGVRPETSPWALAGLPQGTEQTTALGCTATLDGGGVVRAIDMALTSTHVYALLESGGGNPRPGTPGPPPGFVLVRAAR